MTFLAYSFKEDSIRIAMDTLATDTNNIPFVNVEKTFYHKRTNSIICGTGGMDEIAYVVWSISRNDEIDNRKTLDKAIFRALTDYQQYLANPKQSTTVYSFGFSDKTQAPEFSRWSKSEENFTFSETTKEISIGLNQTAAKPFEEEWLSKMSGVVTPYLSEIEKTNDVFERDAIAFALLAEKFSTNIVVGGELFVENLTKDSYQKKQLFTFRTNQKAQRDTTILEFVINDGWLDRFEEIYSTTNKS